MKKIVLIDTSYPINVRNQKIIDSLTSSIEDVEISVISWKRDGNLCEVPDGYYLYNKKSPLGDRLRKLKNLLGFKNFVKQSLREICPNVIIASHWSSLVLVASCIKKEKLIYENLDIPTGPKLIRRVICFFEKRALKKVTCVLHASRFYTELYSASIPQIVLENKPKFEKDYKNKVYQKGTPLKISFIGGLRYRFLLQNLVDSVKNDNRFVLYLHGDGVDYEYFKEYCSGINNVVLTGRYSYSSIVSLYHGSDVVWAAYPNTDFNVKYAISNKFHESLYVGVPCVYSAGTKLADYVEANKIGIQVDSNDMLSIRSLFEQIYNGELDLTEISENMKAFANKENNWSDDFQEVVEIIKK